jgi:hypothetical protein
MSSFAKTEAGRGLAFVNKDLSYLEQLLPMNQYLNSAASGTAIEPRGSINIGLSSELETEASFSVRGRQV